MAEAAAEAVAAAAGGGGGGGGGETTGSVYSDLVLALRDPAGAPILKKYTVPETAETAAAIEYCVQPVSYVAIPGVPSTTNPVDGRTVWVVPLQGAWIQDDTVPADFTGACDTQPLYGMFVKEAELERLNLARTAEAVINQKIADVELKLRFADAIALESTGRILFDDRTIDAAPENAGIYQSLMKSGTIPGLLTTPTTMTGPPAEIGPVTADATSNSRFDAWELAAMDIGAAASKSVPLSIDAVEYYNRIIGFPPAADPAATPPVPEYVSPWGVGFVRSEDPDDPGTELAGSEQFVDYSGFSYNRSQTFQGSVTWLDVPTLTWKVSRITDVVPFTNLSGSEIGTRTLTGITAFAQLADDVRAMCNFVPDNTFLPGFFMDVPGQDTTADQLKAIHDPAVDLGTLPENVFQTFPFEMTASLLNPFGGDLIDEAQLRLTIAATTAFAPGDVTAIAKADGQPLPFTVDASGDLVGTWGPDSGFPVWPGYNVSTTFTATVAAGAPTGTYTVTLDLVDVDDPATVLAQETGTITVNENVSTVLWGTPLPKYTTQASAMTLPVQVYAPEAGTGELTVTVTGPVEDDATPDSEALAEGDLKAYGSIGTDMAAMPLTLDAEGKLVGTWNTTLLGGYTPVAWYITVAEGAPVGSYAFGVGLTSGNTLDPISVVVFAPESHGEQPPDAGEDTTAPVLTVTPATASGSTVSFTLTANESPVDLTCMLTTNGTAGAWEACTSPKTYTDLPPADYVFSAKATDKALNVSKVVTRSWTVAPIDETPPVVEVAPQGVSVPGATATFEITADETDVVFECMLATDTIGGTWSTCTSPVTYSDLAPGTYVLSVRGTDEAGNTSATVATAPWTVLDTTAPLVTITTVKLGTTTTFALTANESGVAFECQLTKDTVVTRPWASCGPTVTYKGLKQGSYALDVRGTDAAGNRSEVVTITWSLRRVPGGYVAVSPADTTAPLVTITTVKLGTTSTFAFSASEPRVTYECQLTKNAVVTQRWARCEPTTTFKGLKQGSYVLSVRGTDAARNPSGVVTFAWSIRKVPGGYLAVPTASTTVVRGTLLAPTSQTLGVAAK